MNDISPGDLLDDINTDAMTPAWVRFDHDATEIAKNAYTGLIVVRKHRSRSRSRRSPRML